jgi:membrane-associated protein
LPGDSLLFAVGTLAAIDTSGTLDATTVGALLIVAAILGNSCNYAIGRWLGPQVFSGRYRFLKTDYLHKTEEYFIRHGGKTIVLSRFLPILRTFAPFVAGVGRMHYGRFQAFNVSGAIAWVVIFLGGGYLFGNIPIVKNNFGIVTLLIIGVSLIPVILLTVSRTPRCCRRSIARASRASRGQSPRCVFRQPSRNRRYTSRDRR